MQQMHLAVTGAASTGQGPRKRARNVILERIRVAFVGVLLVPQCVHELEMSPLIQHW